MNKDLLISELNAFKERMETDVARVYGSNYDLGIERLAAWERAIKKFLNTNLPGYYSRLEKKMRPGGVFFVGGDLYQVFLREEYSAAHSFIDSLILDINNDELDLPDPSPKIEKKVEKITPALEKKAFIVHGHDDATKERTARFLEKLGFKAVILHEQASGGKTIIEKLEHFTDVGFGIVLYTPDDEGSAKSEKKYQPRARQNVVFEHGLLIGKLGREKVFPLVTDHSVELPGDISGMVYLSDRNWEIQLAKEIRELGYQIDMNQVV